MNRREFIKAGTTLAMAPAVLTRAQSPQVIDPAPPRLPAAGADGWVSLLNGRDLSGWYTMLQRSGKGVAEEQRMILMEEEMLHIMGNEEGKFPAEGGYLATNQEFANVRIRVEYKWGVKRHAPRYTPKRDNGLLYGLVGPDRVWPSCVECQIEEGDVGDFFLLGGVRGVQSNHNAGLFGEGINPLTGWPQPGDPGFRGAGAGRAGGAPAAGAATGAGSAQGAGGAKEPLPLPVRPRAEVQRRPRNRPAAASSRMATSSCWISGIRSRSSGRAIARRTSSTAAP